MAELQPAHRIYCSVKGCPESFLTLAEMHHHKNENPEHIYCDVCDVDCLDFEDFIKHKVQSDKHLSCPVCGVDYRSTSGLQRHLRFDHKRAQNIVCVGCGSKFRSPGDMINHLESGRCSKITAQDFQDQLHRKDMIARILVNPGQFGRPALRSINSSSSSLVNVDEDGGVKIDLQPNANNEHNGVHGTNLPLLTSTENGEQSACKNRSNLDFTVKLDDMHMNNGFQRVRYRSHAGPDLTNRDDNFPALDINNKAKPPTSKTDSSSAWNGSLISRAFPKLPRSQTVDDFQAGVDRNITYANNVPNEANGDVSAPPSATVSGKGIFHTKFWDPKCSNYNPDNFYQLAIDKYVCPFAQCNEHFATPRLLSLHLTSDIHRVAKHVCPSCKKRFDTASGLVQHCETVGRRCRISSWDNYGVFINRISGGFLEVKYDGGKRDGLEIMEDNGIKYEATKPAGFW